MSELAEMARLGTVAIAIPAGVFGGNWAFRKHSGYAQSAAADFLLAILIFDAALVVTAKEFEPFVRSPELRAIVMYWHVLAFIVSGFIWIAIVHWGEPILARHYERKRNRPRFPMGTFVACWMSVLAVVASHIGFFVVSGGGGNG